MNLLKVIWEFLMSDVHGGSPKVERKKDHKPYDKTLVTVHMVEFIKEVYEDHIEIHKCRNRKEFTEYINDLLGMDKSYSVICRILAGDYDHRDLPEGEPITVTLTKDEPCHN